MQVEIRIFVIVLQTRLRRLGKSWIEGTSISSVEKFQSPLRVGSGRSNFDCDARMRARRRSKGLTAIP
jgi:hypothetical protein